MKDRQDERVTNIDLNNSLRLTTNDFEFDRTVGVRGKRW